MMTAALHDPPSADRYVITPDHLPWITLELAMCKACRVFVARIGYHGRSGSDPARASYGVAVYCDCCRDNYVYARA